MNVLMIAVRCAPEVERSQQQLLRSASNLSLPLGSIGPDRFLHVSSEEKCHSFGDTNAI